MLDIHISDGVAILRLDGPPLNALRLQVLDQLQLAVRQANQNDAVRGIVVTGREDHFSAGADVKLFDQIASADDAICISRLFQEAFQTLEDSDKPVVAALAGTVVGGALELAMACHFRVAAAGSRFRMPEVNLAINPGAGGTQRLPRLVGLEAALRMLLSAETISAEAALELGLIDAVCPSGRLVEQAQAVLERNPAVQRTCQRTDRLQDEPASNSALAEAEAHVAKVPAEIIAPREILEAVRIGVQQSVQAGLQEEQTAFARCMATLAAQNKIHLFFASSQTSKIPELANVEPRSVTQAAVVGMGTMGTGIAHALALADIPVVIVDQNADALERGLGRIRKALQRRVAQGKLTTERAEQVLQRATISTRWEDVGEADVVVESVYEDVEVKRFVLGVLEGVCPSSTILASNTSTISLDQLAAGMKQPERLVGMHFFNPAHRMPLVEIIRRESTAPAVLATMTKLAKKLRKTAVVVANREGFLVNRVFVPYLQEAFWLLEQGVPAPAIDAAAVRFGFPMGPLVLIDMAGLDILVHAHRVLERAFPHHGPLSSIAARLVEGGHLGQKTGAGIYRYEPGDFAPHHSEATEGIIADVQRQSGRVSRDLEEREITERLVLRMVNEAFYVVQEGIALRESDLDVAMVLGTGFPDYRGGVLKYANDLGRDTVLARLQDLSEQCGERFSPCQQLRETKGIQ